ncbi:MAG: tyrosine--tRNA ligase [Parcubacteria group bacterium]|jgi:tyrosyl-tRNA synthetase
MENLEKKVDEILERGVLMDFLPTKKEFKGALLSGKKLRFYMGADPTAKALHLGHAQNLMVLEDFRKLGHEVIFLIGDFTGMIGDPSDKSSARVKQTPQQVQENFAAWKEQTKNILDFDARENPVQIKYNSEWLGKLNFAEVLELASNFTVQQMLERDMFAKRMRAEKPIYIHEFMYPLMQGYDSVVMDVDVELCGTDQIFNALAGRTLMQKLKNKNKFVVATKLIADEKTGMLMSKSNGTGVFLGMDANSLFGAIMSQTDGMLKPLFLGCTRVALVEIDELMRLENPRDAKVRLAFEIVKIYHGAEEAQKAQDYFVRTISNKEMPAEVAEVDVAKEEIKLMEFIVLAGLAKSNGEARRKIEQGGVEVQEKKELDWQRMLTKEDVGAVVKVGKFNFVKIKFV